MAMTGRQLGPLLACLRLCCPGLPLHILHHPRSLTAAEKQAFLPESVFVQKSMSVELHRQLLLVSGIGDFQLTHTHFQQFAAILGLSRKAAKQRHINPVWLNPLAATGLEAGMVSPFFHPEAAIPFAAVLLFETIPHSNAQVAVSLALDTSLLIPARHLRQVVQTYAQGMYPHIPVLFLPTLSSPGSRQPESVRNRATLKQVIPV